ncbi:MAG: ATP-binding protein [Polyangiaceae bacterium]
MPPGDPLRPGSALPRTASEQPLSSAETDPALDLAAALHEVSNALTVVLGWADAARTAADPESRAAALQVIASRASLAREIARRAIGAAPSHVAPSPIAAVVSDAVLGLSVEANRSAVALEVHTDPRVAAFEVAAGPSLLQILTNLLLNAIAFSPPGTSVRLHIAPASSDRILAVVQDAGPGIPPDLRDRLFEAGVTSRRGGAGIGLRHSAALAAASGGSLRLADTTTTGARFELLWPLASADHAEPAAPHSAPRPVEPRPSIDGARILVIEDDDAVIELLELALESRGASVVSVRAREDLPRVLTTGRFDAALLDMSPLLGDVEGAVAELRRANPQARLVVMSGSVPQANVGGAAMWVRKPFEVREIVDALAAPPIPEPV